MLTEHQMQALLAACDADPQLTAAINEAETVDALIALATERGFEISADDLQAIGAHGDLSDADLEAASGGTASAAILVCVPTLRDCRTTNCPSFYCLFPPSPQPELP